MSHFSTLQTGRTMIIQEEDIWHVLRQVGISEIGDDIVTKGMVKALSIDKDQVYLTLTISREQRGLGQKLRRFSRRKSAWYLGSKKRYHSFGTSSDNTHSFAHFKHIPSNRKANLAYYASKA